MFLTSALAQQIVDIIMPTAQRNINLMDQQGIIIGSGQPERLHTFHQGALEAIRRNATVEILPNALNRYSGSHPGLNMPITLNGQLVGVVGVSGHPDEVRDIARMAKMTAELILKHELRAEEANSQYQLRENVAALLLSTNTARNQEKLFRAVKLLKFDLLLPRLVALFDCHDFFQSVFQTYGHNELSAAKARETIQRLLADSPALDVRDLFAYLENNLIIFKHFPGGQNQGVFQQWGEDLRRILQRALQNPVNAALGRWTADWRALEDSYQDACFALQHSARQTTASIYDYEILAGCLAEKAAEDTLCRSLSPLGIEFSSDAIQKKYDMRNTIATLLRHHLSITQTAKALFIHRNTLVFRLEKFREMTGLDPCRNVDHAFLCKVLLKRQE